MKSAMYPGTFDPFTNGHLDVIQRASRLFDKVVVAVAASTSKGIVFPVEERLQMIQEAVQDMPGVEAITFEGMLIHEFERLGVEVVIRGVRLFQDFEYEYMMALMNRRLCPRFDVVFLMPSENVLSISSTLVKDIHQHGGDVEQLVPPNVYRRLKRQGRRARRT
jgi:pantetheine-phosphate adenylyltransferase